LRYARSKEFLASASCWSAARRFWANFRKGYASSDTSKERTSSSRRYRPAATPVVWRDSRRSWFAARWDIIVAAQVPSVIAAKAATRDIPIIMAPGAEPVALGFVESLARPGGNITGVATLGAEMGAKSLELVLGHHADGAPRRRLGQRQ
jgi:CBS-domain-containing membrane protein